MLAFRDPYGIRPLILGRRLSDQGREEWIVASESLVIENSGYEIVRDVDPGEAVFIDADSNLHQRQCAESPRLIPCLLYTSPSPRDKRQSRMPSSA